MNQGEELREKGGAYRMEPPPDLVPAPAPEVVVEVAPVVEPVVVEAAPAVEPAPVASKPTGLLAAYLSGLPKLHTVPELFDRPKRRWLVKKLVRHGELMVVFGDSGTCKTFLALDLILSIATGRAWCDRPTLQGTVVYLAGEGVGGLEKRIRAWCINADVDPLTLALRILAESLPFMDEDQFNKLLGAIKRLDPKPVVIVVDTMARYMIGGEENSAKDLGVFLTRCSALSAATGATVMIVHHSGKGRTDMRGSSALRGGTDVAIGMSRVGETIEVRGDKCKDDELFPTTYFMPKSLWIGLYDEDNTPETSLVLVECPPPPPDVVKGAKSEQPQQPQPDGGELIRKCLATLFHGEASGSALRDATPLKRSTFYEDLQDSIDEGWIKVTGNPRRPTYRLTPDAPEYVSPSPSPANSNVDSNSHHAASTSESESGADTPLEGCRRTRTRTRGQNSDAEKASRKKKKSSPQPKNRALIDNPPEDCA